MVRNPPANEGDTGSILGLGGTLEEELASHSSILAWKIPWTEEPGRLQPRGYKESDMTEQLNTHTHTHTHYSVEPVVVIHQIRITLSRNMKSLEKVSAELTRGVKEKNLKLQAWVQMPTETLRTTTRIQGGLGKGCSKTWNYFQARMRKQH